MEKSDRIEKWFEETKKVIPSVPAQLYGELFNQAMTEVNSFKRKSKPRAKKKFTFGVGKVLSEKKDSNYDAHLVMSTYKGEKFLRKNFIKIVNMLNKSSYKILLSIVLDSVVDNSDEFLYDVLKNNDTSFSYEFLVFPERRGHVQAMLERVIEYKNIPISGYIDDDAMPINFSFDEIILEAKENDVGAGICVDDRIPETPLHQVLSLYSNSSLASKLPDKLMLHGGGGITFIRTDIFIEGLECAIRSKTVNGPILTVKSFKEGVMPYSRRSFLTQHPSRINFPSWVQMIYYYRLGWESAYNSINDTEACNKFKTMAKDIADTRDAKLAEILSAEEYASTQFIRRLRKNVDDDIYYIFSSKLGNKTRLDYNGKRKLY